MGGKYEKLTDSSPKDTTIQEIYCYDKNGEVYADILYCEEISHGEWIMDRPYVKPNFYYVKDGLSFTFDRDEKLNNLDTSVYISEIESVMQKGNTREEAIKIIREEACMNGFRGVVDIRNFGRIS